MTKPSQAFAKNFVDICRILTFLDNQNHRVTLLEIHKAIHYPKNIRSLQRFLTQVQAVSQNQLRSDGSSPQGWWLASDLETAIRKISEVQYDRNSGRAVFSS